MREYLENDGEIDDEKRRSLEVLAERIGIEAKDMEQLIASVLKGGAEVSKTNKGETK